METRPPRIRTNGLDWRRSWFFVWPPLPSWPVTPTVLPRPRPLLPSARALPILATIGDLFTWRRTATPLFTIASTMLGTEVEQAPPPHAWKIPRVVVASGVSTS